MQEDNIVADQGTVVNATIQSTAEQTSRLCVNAGKMPPDQGKSSINETEAGIEVHKETTPDPCNKSVNMKMTQIQGKDGALVQVPQESQILENELEELNKKLDGIEENTMERMLLEMRIHLKKDNLKMMKKFEDVTSKTNSLSGEINLLKANKTEVGASIKSIKETQISEATKVSNISTDLDYLYDQVRILNGVVQKHEQTNYLRREQDEMVLLRNMRDNLIISGLDEVSEENETSTAEVVTDFFSQTMKMERKVSLHKATRVGKSKPRTVFVQLQNGKDKSDIFKHASNLKNVRNNDDKGIYVNNQLPPQMQEKRRWYRYLMRYNANLASGKKTLKIKKGQLYVNDVPFTPAIRTPTTDEIMYPADEAHVERIQLLKGREYRKGNCCFIGYSAEVRSLADVRAAYVKVARLNSDALHLTCAYKLAGADFVHLHGYIDNFEHGAGRTIYFAMEDNNVMNRAVFVVRYYGNQHLGPTRFQLIRDAAKSAMQMLEKRPHIMDRNVQMKKYHLRCPYQVALNFHQVTRLQHHHAHTICKPGVAWTQSKTILVSVQEQVPLTLAPAMAASRAATQAPQRGMPLTQETIIKSL